MVYGLWEINGVVQTQTIAGNAATSRHLPSPRLVWDARVSGVSPTIRDTLVTVEDISSWIDEGFSRREFFLWYPEIEEADIEAALLYVSIN